MKVDLLVYGRGAERDNGYQLFANPPYWTEQMLLAMSGFNDLWINGDLSNSQTAAFSACENPWGHTYMFIAMPEPFCCALLRCTRVEDNKGGWLKEIRNYDVWSMEGVCCPYNDKELFWAMIPSIILWLERDNKSLYRRLIDNKIGRSVEIPEDLLFNPFYENSMSEELLSVMGTETARNAMVNLCNHIHCSNGPSHFIFGPLADYFNETVGSSYAIVNTFSTLGNMDLNFKDPFDEITCIRRRTFKKESVEYNLRIRFNRNNDDISARYWELAEISEKEPSLISNMIPVDCEKGIDLFDLYAEAETIINFTKKLDFFQPDPSGDSCKRFNFRKE